MRTTLVEMDAPLSGNIMGVWLLIIRPDQQQDLMAQKTQSKSRQAGFKY